MWLLLGCCCGCWIWDTAYLLYVSCIPASIFGANYGEWHIVSWTNSHLITFLYLLSNTTIVSRTDTIQFNSSVRINNKNLRTWIAFSEITLSILKILEKLILLMVSCQTNYFKNNYILPDEFQIWPRVCAYPKKGPRNLTILCARCGVLSSVDRVCGGGGADACLQTPIRINKLSRRWNNNLSGSFVLDTLFYTMTFTSFIRSHHDNYMQDSSIDHIYTVPALWRPTRKVRYSPDKTDMIVGVQMSDSNFKPVRFCHVVSVARCSI